METRLDIILWNHRLLYGALLDSGNVCIVLAFTLFILLIIPSGSLYIHVSRGHRIEYPNYDVYMTKWERNRFMLFS